jgi:hypothetical protein
MTTARRGSATGKKIVSRRSLVTGASMREPFST